MTTPATSPGRAFLVYSGLRLALLLLCLALLQALGLEGLLAVGGAVLMSALLSLVLLRRQRDAFTDASIARADERRAAKASRRARLDEPPAA
jgi:hypothetical protein